MSACRNIYTSLLLVLAGASNKELARQVKYLKVENEILRKRIPGRIRVTPAEKVRLLKFASKIAGKVLQQIVSIVHPGTMIHWLQLERRKGKKHIPKRRVGRPGTPEAMCKLILRMAKENDWGYTRIMGELKKMGIKPPSRNTVKKILQAAGRDPGPPKGEGSWDEFIKRHADSLWQCDFFSRKIMTPKGIRQAFVLIFIHVQSRRVFLSPSTHNQTPEWVAEQSEIIVDRARSSGLKIAQITRDNDGAYSKNFDDVMKMQKVQVVNTSFRAPNMNAYVERFIQTIQLECTDHFVICGTRHFDYLCKEFLEHYHTERPHQALENCVPMEAKRKGRKKAMLEKATIPKLGDVKCRSRLSGLLKSYERAA